MKRHLLLILPALMTLALPALADDQPKPQPQQREVTLAPTDPLESDLKAQWDLAQQLRITADNNVGKSISVLTADRRALIAHVAQLEEQVKKCGDPCKEVPQASATNPAAPHNPEQK